MRVYSKLDIKGVKMEEILKSIDNKMNAIITLLLNQSKFKQDEMLERDKIKILSDVGLSNQELAKLFSKTAQQVSDQIYKAKKSKK